MDYENGHPLRQIGEGGLGFCYDADRALFLVSELQDGPLVVALDTNILSDLLQHGDAIVNGGPIDGEISAEDERELRALGYIVDVWMKRDLRFIPLARSIDDARKGIAPARRREREEALNRIAASLTFQTADWAWDWKTGTAWSDSLDSPVTEADIPGSADRELVRAALHLRADVFLTRDKRILRASARPHISINLLSPSQLAVRLYSLGLSLFDGGLVEHSGCVYSDGVPFGDSGKWVGLLELINQRSAQQ